MVQKRGHQLIPLRGKPCPTARPKGKRREEEDPNCFFTRGCSLVPLHRAAGTISHSRLLNLHGRIPLTNVANLWMGLGT